MSSAVEERPTDALPVLVLISSAALFESLNDISDTLLPSECHCLVYYIRYDPFALRFHLPSVDFDNVKKVLKPLPVRVHVTDSPQDLRRIMAESWMRSPSCSWSTSGAGSKAAAHFCQFGA